MRLQLFIVSDNVTLEDPYEVGRILREAAKEAEAGGPVSLALKDINGNVVGRLFYNPVQQTTEN